MTPRVTGPRRPGRPKGRPAKTREEIREAAARVFREKGYYRASMDDVAAALGMTKPSLYYYVPTKRDLLFELVLPPYRESLAHLRDVRASGLPAARQVAEIVRRHLVTVAAHHPAVSVYIADARHLDVPDELRRLDREYEEGLHSALAEGVADGTLRPHDSELAAMAIVGMCNRYALRFRPGADDPGRVAEQLASIVMDGLEREVE